MHPTLATLAYAPYKQILINQTYTPYEFRRTKLKSKKAKKNRAYGVKEKKQKRKKGKKGKKYKRLISPRGHTKTDIVVADIWDEPEAVGGTGVGRVAAPRTATQHSVIGMFFA